MAQLTMSDGTGGRRATGDVTRGRSGRWVQREATGKSVGIGQTMFLRVP